MKNKFIILTIATIIGGTLGYCYYYFFGCETNCTLKSNWEVTTLYGAILGFIAGFPKLSLKKK